MQSPENNRAHVEWKPMTKYILSHVFKFCARMTFTVFACVVLERLIAAQGYRVELQQLLVGACLVIVSVRLWMPWRSGE